MWNRGPHRRVLRVLRRRSVRSPRDGRLRLRLGGYAAAPREHVLRPWVASSLFPHLPHRSRTPLRVGLAVLLVLLAGFALLRWQAPMIAVAAVGFPLLFVTYLREIDVRQNVSLRSLILTAVIGVVLGVGWAYIAGTVFADGYDVALGFETDAGPTVVVWRGHLDRRGAADARPCAGGAGRE